jgi:23S rRNA pseudouridine1911/1915/1917 synthase
LFIIFLFMETKPFEVIFEDDYLIAVDKRSGLLVVPTPKKEKYTLNSLIDIYLKEKNEKAFACHRLDRDTSGIILYAKDKNTQGAIMGQFRNQTVGKRYLAIVQGRVIKYRGIIKGYIKPKGKPPKFAITKYKVLKRFKKFSLLEVEPKTGRNNQIRIHLEQIGHPIVGERKYAIAKDWPIKFKRLCLHSCLLEFRHPVSKDLVRLSRDVPKDLREFLHSQGLELRFLGH